MDCGTSEVMQGVSACNMTTTQNAIVHDQNGKSTRWESGNVPVLILNGSFILWFFFHWNVHMWIVKFLVGIFYPNIKPK